MSQSSQLLCAGSISLSIQEGVCVCVCHCTVPGKVAVVICKIRASGDSGSIVCLVVAVFHGKTRAARAATESRRENMQETPDFFFTPTAEKKRMVREKSISKLML